MPAVTNSIRITIVSLLACLLLAFAASSIVSATPKVKGVPVKIPYKYQGDKLETLGYALDIDWQAASEEGKEYIRKYHEPRFFRSPGGKWILIDLAIDRYLTNVWIYDSRIKEKPRFVKMVIFWGSALYWYGDEVVEYQWSRMGFTTNVFVRLTESLAVAGLENAIFYGTESDIYLALNNDLDRDITNGLLEVGRLFGGKSHKKEELGTLELKAKQYREFRGKWITEVTFDKDAMIIKVDWPDKTRYVKLHPKFLKGRK